MTRFTGSARPTDTQSAPETSGQPRPVPRVRTGGSLVAFTASAVVLLLLLIFILQNGQRAVVHFFGMQGHLPMGVALLLAAVSGVLLVTVQATVRSVIQLRRSTPGRRTRRATTVTRPDPAGTDPFADVPKGRN